LKWLLYSLLAYCTTDKRPASHLVSRFYRTGYSVPDNCRYRRLVLLVLLSLLPSLDPLLSLFAIVGQAFKFRLSYSVFKVLKNMFSASLFNN
jgi:hypothetical protein